jgi:DNA-directed RNA polymerase I subunit RPA1
MYKLLRSTCLHCFQLKMAQKEVDKYTERLTLLAKGKLTEAAAVMTGGGKAADFAKSLIEAGEEGKNANESVIKGKSKGTQKPRATTAPLDGMRTTYSLPSLLCCLGYRSA